MVRVARFVLAGDVLPPEEEVGASGGGSKIAVETGTAAVGGKAVMDGPAASLGISRKVGTMTGWKNG